MLKVLVPLGTFIVTVGTAFLFYRMFRVLRLNRLGIYRNTRTAYFLKELQFKTDKLIERVKSDKKASVARLSIALLFAAGSGRDFKEMLQYFIVGYILAAAAIYLVARARKSTVKNKKMKDIAILFEAVELYMKGGYSLIQALMLSRSLVPGLRNEIDVCLDYWTEGPRTALEKFNQALDLEEGEILVSLLIYMEMAGTKDLSGVLSREAFNVERLRRLKTESSISLRPIYLMVYRFLPLTSAIGIITGPLLYRTYVVLRDARILGF